MVAADLAAASGRLWEAAVERAAALGESPLDHMVERAFSEGRDRPWGSSCSTCAPVWATPSPQRRGSEVPHSRHRPRRPRPCRGRGVRAPPARGGGAPAGAARPRGRRRAVAGRRRPGSRRAAERRGRSAPRLRDRRLMDIAAFDAGLLQATIARALRRGGDFAEVFVEDRDSLGLRLEDGRVEQTSGGREVGAAVRLLSGEHTYYAYSDAVDEAGMTAAADAVAAAVRAGDGGSAVIALGLVRSDPGRPAVRIPPETVAIARKARLGRAGDEAARAAGAEVSQAIVGYGDTHQKVLIANSLGDLVYDDRTRTRFTARAVATRAAKKALTMLDEVAERVRNEDLLARVT